MSEFYVVVVQVGKVEPHPNADRLEITRVWDYPVITGKGEFKEGDKAVYIPVDSLVPAGRIMKDEATGVDFCEPNPGPFAFLWHEDRPRDLERVRAKKLRGIYSQGILVRAKPEWQVGQNVQEELGISKYEPLEPISFSGEDEKNPKFIPVYTDIEGLRRYPTILQEGEEVVIHEKLHGSNSRYLYDGERLWAGSHRCIKKFNPDNLWWKSLAQNNLEEKLKAIPGIVVYGEVYGRVQDLHYGAGKNDLFFAAFDAYSIHKGQYLDYDEFIALTILSGLPTVPLLYRGPWFASLRSLAEGVSTLADHVREGIVIRPIKERWNPETGRTIFKFVGEGYLTRKGG